MEILNQYLSGAILPALLIILGIYFAFKLKWFYILHPIKATRTMLKHQKGSLKSLSLALAGTLGVGNIVGVASAIMLGGAGSIFWMWISAICAMSLKYVEVFLAIRFRRNQKGIYYGGAPYYIKDGLKEKIGESHAYILSLVFAIFCIVNSLTTGNLVQINSVSSLLPVSPLYFGVVFTLFAIITIVGGIKRISKITSFLIPLLTIVYVAICLFIVLNNLGKIPNILIHIVKDAFSIKSAAFGFAGFGISCSIRYGVSRGILSNEAGCGTSPSAHASSENNDPHAQGCLGIFEVFVDTILLCTLTALVILIANATYESNPMQLVLSSFERYVGITGANIVTVLCILFAFATVICQFFYGIESLNYITKNKKSKTVFLFIFSTVLLIGAVIPMSIMWQISDLAIAIMTIVNLVCLFLLRNSIK